MSDAVNRGHVHRVLAKTMHAVALRDESERAVIETAVAGGMPQAVDLREPR
jgi:hypothetical protein